MTHQTATPRPEFPWYPEYVDDTLALAATLSNDLLAAYVRLRAHAWKNDPPCTLPIDDEELAMLSNTGDRWAAALRVFTSRKLLVAADGRLIMPQVLERYEEQLKRYRISQVRKAAGSEGGRRSAQVRGNRPPSRDRSNHGSNGRSSVPSKTGDLVRGALGSLTAGTTENLERAEASAEAKPLDVKRLREEAERLQREGRLQRTDSSAQDSDGAQDASPYADATPADGATAH